MGWKLFTAMALLLGATAVASCDSGEPTGKCNAGRTKVNGVCECINDSNDNGVCDEEESLRYDVFQDIKAKDVSPEQTQYDSQPELDILVNDSSEPLPDIYQPKDQIGVDITTDVSEPKEDTPGCQDPCSLGASYCQDDLFLLECKLNEDNCTEFQKSSCSPKVCEEGECIDGCVPDCYNKECGSSGCEGWSCGECGPNEECTNNICYGPGEFLDSCLDYTDCLTEVCATDFKGDKFCTEMCFTDCPEGLECQNIPGIDYMGGCFMAVEDKVGWPCNSDSDCGGQYSSAICIPTWVGDSCTISCIPELGCPKQMECTYFPDIGKDICDLNTWQD